jgi:hypothetical protein
MPVMRDMMARLKLTVNDTKTKLCRVPDESFDSRPNFVVKSNLSFLRSDNRWFWPLAAQRAIRNQSPKRGAYDL